MPDKTDKTTKPTLPADNSIGMSIPASMLRVGVVEVAKDGSYVTVRLWPTMPTTTSHRTVRTLTPIRCSCCKGMPQRRMTKSTVRGRAPR